jgi:tRNA A64-2'-O-ribosylphosphate transferase
VQGAADDEEAWAHGLTSSLFWENQEQLLNCTQDEEVISVIEQIVARKVTSASANDVSAIGTTGLLLGVGATRPGTVQIICGMNGPSVRSEKDALYVSLPTKQAKPLAIMIKEIFPAAVSFAQTHDILRGPAITILATDSSRQLLDLSIALTLVLLVLFFNDKGTIPF